MEGVAGAGSVIALLQITEEIVKLCGGYLREVRGAAKEIERLQSKVMALGEVLQRFKHRPESKLEISIQSCREDLASLEATLKPTKRQPAKKWMDWRALKWPFNKREVKDQVRTLEGYLNIFNTALSQDTFDESMLDKLAFAGDAQFDSGHNVHRHRTCLEHTRVHVLQQITDWVADDSPRCIFWLQGLAGTGKSTIATTVASTRKKQFQPYATYFFQRGHESLAHVRKLIPTLARQVSKYSPSFRRAVVAAIKEEPGIGQSGNLRDQYQKLLVEPLRKSRSPGSVNPSCLIVMEALDECDDQNDLRMLLKLLAKTDDMPTLGVKILVTSRPEMPIRHGFEEIPSILHRSLALQDVPRPVVDGDIRLYLRHDLENTQKRFRLPPDWPVEADLSILAEKAGGLFIFAATACRYIGGSPLVRPQDRLEQICHSAITNNLMTEELDQMYSIILQSAIRGRYTKEERNSITLRFRYVIGSIVLLFDPLPVGQLFAILKGALVESREELQGILQTLNAVFDDPKGTEDPVQALHLSFRDFLLDPARCLDPCLRIDEQQTHQMLAEGCIRLLSGSLDRNMCNLPSVGTLKTEIDPQIIDTTYSRAVRYACRYWAQHALKSAMPIADQGYVHTFLKRHLLHWLESMSLLKCISDAIIGLRDLAAKTKSQWSPLVHDFIYDCHRFVLTFRGIIDEAPEQVYVSALLFSPVKSSVRRNYQHTIPTWVALSPEPDDYWSPNIQTVQLGYGVDEIDLLPDGKRMAFSSKNHGLTIFDLQRGECHSPVNDILPRFGMHKLSPDGSLVALESSYGEVGFWDIAKSEYRWIIKEAFAKTPVLVFSPDSRLVAFESGNGSIRLLVSETGSTSCELDGHSSDIRCIRFSPDSQSIAAGAADETIRLWAVGTGSLHMTIDSATSGWSLDRELIFSPSSELLLLGFDGKRDRYRAQVWDVLTRKLRFRISYLSPFAHNLRFSPNSERLAIISHDTLLLFSTFTGDVLSRPPFPEAHTVSFSPDGRALAVGTRNGLVQIWDIQEQRCSCTFHGHTSTISALCFSTDGHILASASHDGTIRLWDLHENYIPSAPEGGRVGTLGDEVHFSPDGQFLAMEAEKCIRLWRTGIGSYCSNFDGSEPSFSPDSQCLVFSRDNGIRFLDLRTKSDCLVWTKQSNLPLERLMPVFSPDHQALAFLSSTHSINIWNIQAQEIRFTLQASGSIKRLVFSEKSEILLSMNFKNGAQVWNTLSGEHISNLDIHSFIYACISLAPDGKLFAYLSKGSLSIWATLTGTCLYDLKVDYGIEKRIKFSHDGCFIAVSGHDSVSGKNLVDTGNTQTGDEVLTVPYNSFDPRIEFSADHHTIFIDDVPHALGPKTLAEEEIIRHKREKWGIQVDSSRKWVTRYSQRVLWLPPERRIGPYGGYLVHGKKIMIASKDGNVTFLKFAGEPDSLGRNRYTVE
ncbi:MAG: hypothetical protein Q9220_006268 [cf. Caloplaca sp. 1 TL-2023]